MPRPLLSRASLLCFLALAWGAAAPVAQGASYDLQPAQAARLKKFMPRTLAKLERHEPVTVVELGDSVMDYRMHTEDSGNALNAYTGVFLQMLADQFYYVGGVRLERPRKTQPEKLRDIQGPEIALRKLCARDRLTMVDGVAALEDLNDAKQTPPDLMLLDFGVFDAMQHEELKVYRQALVQIIEFCKKRGMDLFLLGPPLVMPPPIEKGLGMTRPYAAVMQEEATAHGLFFADLGDLAWLAHVDERWAPLPAAVDGVATSKKLSLGPPNMEPVEIRVPDGPDPNPENKVQQFFTELADRYRKHLDHDETAEDPFHPAPHLHRVLGRRIFAELMDGSKTSPWKVLPATGDFSGDNQLTVNFPIENPGTTPLRVFLFPVEVEGWLPRSGQTYLDIPAGSSLPVSFVYQGSGKEAARALHLPVLVIGQGVPRFEVLRVGTPSAR